MLCQFENNLEVIYLPVYKPNLEERNDPRLFANNVRKQMAKVMDVPMTSHTYDDVRLQLSALKKHHSPTVVNVATGALRDQFGALSTNDISTQLDAFLAIDADGD